MASFNIRSDYYRMLRPFCSTEETRYYIGGVYIEPHPVEGVVMVATDGHRMMVAHDVTGSCSEPVIVKIDGAALRAGKCRKSDPKGRRFIANDDGIVTVEGGGGEHEIFWRIDGTFPDWRRVLPEVKPSKDTPAFSPVYLADFGSIWSELHETKPAMLLRASGAADPALVEFSHPDFFGVLMPVRFGTGMKPGLPYFMSPKYLASETAEVA